MRLDSFNYNYPSKYDRFNFVSFINNNYDYYNVNNISKTCKIILHNLIKRNRYICVSLSPNEYTKAKISYKNLKNAIQVLLDLNMINIEIGSRNYTGKSRTTNEWMYDKRKAQLTRVYMKPMVDWKIESINLSWWDLTQAIFCTPQKIKNKVINRTKINTKIKKKIKNKIVDKKVTLIFDQESQNNGLNESLNYINRFMKKKGYSNLQYQRVFGTNDKINGRFSNPLQNVKKTIRQKVLDEKDWKEIDFKSCAINILYLIDSGKMYDGDIYEDILKQVGLPIEFRPFLKTLLISALNTKSKKDAIRSIRKTLVEEGLYSKYKSFEFEKYILNSIPKCYEYSHTTFKKYYKIEDYYLFTPEYILSFFESITILNKYLYNSSSEFTQNIESNVIEKIMIKMISNNILPITIHDCIIVPKDTLFDYESYMYSLLIKECFYYKYFISNLYQKERNKKDKSIALLFILFKYVFIKNTISFLVRKFDYG